MPNLATSRRDPQNGKNGFSNIKGFTVIELMIGIAVLAIITSLAFPSFRSIQEKRQVTKGAEQFAAFVSQVKGEAVKLNEDVTLSYSVNDGWCMVFSDGQNPCVCDTGVESCEVLDSSTLFDKQGNSSTETELVFEATRGMISLDSPAAQASIAMVSFGGLYALNVEIDRLGRVSLCVPDTTDHSPVPGYKQCSL